MQKKILNLSNLFFIFKNKTDYLKEKVKYLCNL